MSTEIIIAIFAALTAAQALDTTLYGRKAWDWLALNGLDPNAVILRKDWDLVCRLIRTCYAPNDWGALGKQMEVGLRLARSHAAWTRFYNFRAHRQGTSDGLSTEAQREVKTGAGTWLRAKGARTPEELIALMSKRTSEFELSREDLGIHTICSWAEQLEWMSEYPKAKGDVLYWFREDTFEVSPDGTASMSIQYWMNSKAKADWLRENPYNILG